MSVRRKHHLYIILPLQEFVYAATATVLYVIAASVQVARTQIGDVQRFVEFNSGSFYDTYSRYMAAGVRELTFTNNHFKNNIVSPDR